MHLFTQDCSEGQFSLSCRSLPGESAGAFQSPCAINPCALPPERTFRIACAMSSGTSGIHDQQETLALPARFQEEHEIREAITGVPQAIASIMGKPETLSQRRKEQRFGCAAYRLGMSSSGTKPGVRTRPSRPKSRIRLRTSCSPLPVGPTKTRSYFSGAPLQKMRNASISRGIFFRGSQLPTNRKNGRGRWYFSRTAAVRTAGWRPVVESLHRDRLTRMRSEFDSVRGCNRTSRELGDCADDNCASNGCIDR